MGYGAQAGAADTSDHNDDDAAADAGSSKDTADSEQEDAMSTEGDETCTTPVRRMCVAVQWMRLGHALLLHRVPCP